MKIRITHTDPQNAAWSVESESMPGTSYSVTYYQRGPDNEIWRCTCPSRKRPCKHILAIQNAYECACDMDVARTTGGWADMEAAEHDAWNGTRNTGMWRRIPDAVRGAYRTANTPAAGADALAEHIQHHVLPDAQREDWTFDRDRCYAAKSALRAAATRAAVPGDAAALIAAVALLRQADLVSGPSDGPPAGVDLPALVSALDPYRLTDEQIRALQPLVKYGQSTTTWQRAIRVPTQEEHWAAYCDATDEDALRASVQAAAPLRASSRVLTTTEYRRGMCTQRLVCSWTVAKHLEYSTRQYEPVRYEGPFEGIPTHIYADTKNVFWLATQRVEVL